MTNYEPLPQDILSLFQNTSEEELLEKIDVLNLSEDRKGVLLEILTGKKHLDYFIKRDVQLYALKKLFPEQYEQLLSNGKLDFKCDLYEYDPAKNGQNIIQHGISFGEVVSYSNRFGTLIVPCPDDRDETRSVILSDLSPGKDGENLSLPLKGTSEQDEAYTLSVVQCSGLKFRFISSRVLSRKKYYKNMRNALKNIYDDDPDKKRGFVEDCVNILERRLFREKA
ncbi:MAG: BrnT family toxin [Pseudomonadales bacterium]|nr:BrnT family toxin [Pseudomonadales bacterium]